MAFIQWVDVFFNILFVCRILLVNWEGYASVNETVFEL